jgi:hypothetical protein
MANGGEAFQLGTLKKGGGGAEGGVPSNQIHNAKIKQGTVTHIMGQSNGRKEGIG